jgi:DNA-binding response OmpR family regulator
MSTLMVVDDEDRVRNFLTHVLSSEGHSVITARDGTEALQRLAEQQVHLMLLDLMMPRCNGLQVLTGLADNEAAPPVIVLSGVGEVAARVQALDRGAADFVSKPFHLAELLARVRRELKTDHRDNRQTGPYHGERYLSAGGIRLDLDRRHAVSDGTDVVLSEREFSLLAHLMRRRGDVCRRDELLHDIWGLTFDPQSNVVEVCVRRIRHKLRDAPIETVRGVGYCFDGA